MTVLPDPGELDALARRIAAHATAARCTAHRLERHSASTVWRGAAARASELGTADTVAALRRAADHIDEAALALHRHARTVELTIGALHTLAVRTGRALDDVVSSVADDAGSLAAGAAHLIGV